MHLNAVLQVGPSEPAGFWPSSSEHPDRRGASRRSLTLSAVASSPSSGDLSVTIRDISPTGFLIEAESNAISEGEMINIELPDKGIVFARVAWASDRFFGCSLDEAISPGAISAALLRADAPALQAQLAIAVGSMLPAHRTGPIQLGPELNFSVAFRLSVLFWAVIGSGVYLAVG